MQVRVRFFATVRDAAGAEECSLVLEPGARGTEAKMVLVNRFPRLAGLIEYTRLAINQEYQSWEALLHTGDELGLLPPVSGG